MRPPNPIAINAKYTQKRCPDNSKSQIQSQQFKVEFSEVP